jgi:hypothetical protein
MTEEQIKKRRENERRWRATRTPEQIEKKRQRMLEYRRKNKETAKKTNKQWRAVRSPEQRERDKQGMRKYQQQNPEKVNAINHRRRARKKSQIHPKLNRQLEEAIHDQCIHLTHTTGILHHVDHIIPLSCGGWHHHDNLQCLPANLNLQKKDNPVWEHHGYKCWRDVPTHLWPEQLDKLYSSLLV